MPLIELPEREYLKVIDEILEFGPITLLPDDLVAVKKAHIRFLDERGIKYKLKDWKVVSAQRKRAEAKQT